MDYSVIIPVYNRKKVVCDAIESVLSQSVKKYEIIVVDDGSSDGTGEVVRERYGAEVKYVRQKNKGPAAARNKGISNATGKYITFLDSDDVWLPWTLSTFERAISRHDHPSFVIGTQKESNLDAGNDVQVDSSPYESEEWEDYYSASLAKGGLIEPPSVRAIAVEAETLRNVGGFTTENVNFEDADLWMRLGTARGFVHVKSPPVAVYRRHEDGISNDPSRVYEGICKLIVAEQEGRYPGGREYRGARSHIITLYTRSKSVELANRGEAKSALDVYVKTIDMNLLRSRWKYIYLFPFYLVYRIIVNFLRGASNG